MFFLVLTHALLRERSISDQCEASRDYTGRIALIHVLGCGVLRPRGDVPLEYSRGRLDSCSGGMPPYLELAGEASASWSGGSVDMEIVMILEDCD
jgi:hypothetical protein